jgi:glycosyltransferase involved in cell wall biosynthesis
VKTISIISPCYNEEENVRACYEAVRVLFENELSGYRREHIFSDNASIDSTVAILREIAKNDTNVKVIINARNFGPFRSMFNGLRYATGDAVLVFLPVDLQDPPELIPQFVKHWEQGIDVVAGARANREETFLLRSCRWIFYRIVNGISDFEIPPDVGEFQLIDRKVWEAVVTHNDHYPYLRGIIASCGFTRLIIPYTWRARKRDIFVYQCADAFLHFCRVRTGSNMHSLRAGLRCRLYISAASRAPWYDNDHRLGIFSVGSAVDLHRHVGRIRHFDPFAGPQGAYRGRAGTLEYRPAGRGSNAGEDSNAGEVV